MSFTNTILEITVTLLKYGSTIQIVKII